MNAILMKVNKLPVDISIENNKNGETLKTQRTR